MFDHEEPHPVGLEDERAFETSLLPADELAELPEAEILDHADQTDKAGGSTIISRPNWVGKQFARFKLLRLLGQGTMGRVILAEDVHLHRALALKVLRKQIKGMDGEMAVQQFLREARAAAKLDHPNVVRIYEINEHDGWWYIAMEYVNGETLTRLVDAAGPLPPQRAAALIADAAVALHAAHEHGVIHRDVKPSNVMVNRNGIGKLTDFGLVRLDADRDPFEVSEKSVGTPKFMAPEVIRRGEQGPAIDVYSLGATFCFALTGRPPYTGTTVKEILRQHIKAPPPDVRDASPACPAALAMLIQAMMAKDPAARPAPGDVAATLRAQAIEWRWESDAGLTAPGSTITGQSGVDYADGSTVSDADGRPLARPAAPRPRWRRTAGGAVALAAVAVAIVLLAVFNNRTQPIGDANPAAKTLNDMFPDTPATYGDREPGQVPVATDPRQDPPPHSWIGKLDTNDIRFVAHRDGRHFYPADSTQAALISSEYLVGFANEQDARAAGKLPYGD